MAVHPVPGRAVLPFFVPIDCLSSGRWGHWPGPHAPAARTQDYRSMDAHCNWHRYRGMPALRTAVDRSRLRVAEAVLALVAFTADDYNGSQAVSGLLETGLGRAKDWPRDRDERNSVQSTVCQQTGY